MARPGPLEPAAVEAALAELDGWSLRDGKLRRSFRFADFRSAFAFMTRAAFAADAMDHHPDWCNVYDRVEVELTTHDAGAITELDVELARRMDEAARGLVRNSS